MKTKTQVKSEFLSDLNDLLLKYGAEIEAHNTEYGNYWITVDISSAYDADGNCVSEDCCIDLGRYVTGSPKED